MNQRAKRAIALAAGVGGALALKRLWPAERYSFADRSVLITGASRGLGLVLARQLAQEGAWLTILARDEDELERAALDLRARGAEVLALPCDVRDRRQVEQVVERAVERYGSVDVLINNAGVIQTGPLEHMGLEDFQESMDIHLWGPLYAILAVVPHMRQKGGGRIVNITSIGGRVAVPHLAPYCASKFAAVGLSDGMRNELAKSGIVVTTVCPGLMRTGSPFNAFFKGQHRTEFTLFTIMASLPGLTMDERRAARQIIEACRSGSPHLTISLPARLLEIANVLVPGLVARTMAMTTRLLPGPTDEAGDQKWTGWESRTRLAPSALTHFSNEAALRNNEIGGQQPER